MHPQSGNKFLQNEAKRCESKDLKAASKRNLKKSLQKVLEKFGGLKKMLYLCTTFRFEIERSGFSNGSLIYWYNKRENVVFICQFFN